MPVHSRADVEQLELPGRFDLIWVGSLFTHHDPDRWDVFFDLLGSSLADGGVLVFTTAGRHVARSIGAGELGGVSAHDAERMLADYRETGLSVDSHPLALLRPHLPAGTLTSVELHGARHGAPVSFAGLTVARQRPSTAKGVVFMLLEDEHGQVNLVVPSEVYEHHRSIVRTEPLLLARGRFERVDRNRNVLVSTLESLSALARTVAGSDDVVVSLPRAHHFGHR